MRVLIVEPHKLPYETDLGNDLHSMQKVVGGLIEPVQLDDDTILVCNEEGKCLELEGNRRVEKDIIAGTFFVCGFDDEGEFCSLSDDQAKDYAERFKEDERYTAEEVEDSIVIEVYSVDDNYCKDEDELEI